MTDCLSNRLRSSRSVEENGETPTLGLHSIEEYRPLVGDETVNRILAKASELQDLHIVGGNVGGIRYQVSDGEKGSS
jgi:hypothetical protein